MDADKREPRIAISLRACRANGKMLALAGLVESLSQGINGPGVFPVGSGILSVWGRVCAGEAWNYPREGIGFSPMATLRAPSASSCVES